jgi:hypothetical protein
MDEIKLLKRKAMSINSLMKPWKVLDSPCAMSFEDN